jgi:hypothetical protein
LGKCFNFLGKKTIEVYAVLEIMIIQQKAYSSHNDVGIADDFIEVIWKDVEQRLSTTVLLSPLQTRLGRGFISKHEWN